LTPLLAKHAAMKVLKLIELRQNNSSESIKFRFPDKSGNWHDIEATANLVEDKHGTGFNILIISRDVTVRTRGDDELKKLYQAEIELRRALEDEIKKRAEFFRALVHELKTPLTPIIASSEAVMNLSDEPTMKRLAANAFNGAMRLNSRVDELLDLSRGEMGMLKLNCQPMNLLSLIKDLADYVQAQVDANNQKLSLDLPQHLPRVLADESRLRQVILNLLNNAMKFMPKGGHITVQAHAVGENVVVEVSDTGQGIDESEQKRLFQPYNRIEADRQHFSGLGLGLALCKKLIDLHNGKIWCHSQKGRGSTFGFSVAIYQEPSPSAQRIASQGLNVPL
jgi:signal transduction histidine kinase